MFLLVGVLHRAQVELRAVVIVIRHLDKQTPALFYLVSVVGLGFGVQEPRPRHSFREDCEILSHLDGVVDDFADLLLGVDVNQ